jgi:valyl-tRNA synthetase
MGIASLQGQYLALAMQQTDVEFKLTILSNRRQSLTYKSSAIMDDYMKKMQKNIDNQNLDQAAQNIQTFTTEEFQAEYEAASNRISAEDKRLELEVANLTTKQKAISALAEGTQKQLQKNTEKEFSSSMG